MNQVLFIPPVLQVLRRTHEVDLVLLERLREAMWDAPSIGQLMTFIDRQKLEAYTTGPGLVLLETADWVRGRELSVYGIVGRDTLKRGREIVEDLKAIARHKGCSMIGGTGIPRGWLKAAPKLGFTPVSTHFVMEID